MPVHHGASTPDRGPLIRVRVGLTRPDQAARRAAGQPIPSAVELLALLDTGAEGSCLDDRVVARLDPTPRDYGLVNYAAAGGLTPSVLYEVELTIPHPTAPRPHWLVVPDLEVEGVDLSGAGCDAILGRDVLARCVFTYDGLTDSFTLSY
jgi:hypothetical protein